MNLDKRCCIRISWPDICEMISQEIEDILGICMPCKFYKEENLYWDIGFVDDRLPLSKLFQLLQTVGATRDDWMRSLPSEVGTDVADIGMALSERLLSRHIKYTWEHSLITANSLWLVGVHEKPHEDYDGGAL